MRRSGLKRTGEWPRERRRADANRTRFVPTVSAFADGASGPWESAEIRQIDRLDSPCPTDINTPSTVALSADNGRDSGRTSFLHRPHRLTVRTLDFQSRYRGSNPLGVIRKSNSTPVALKQPGCFAFEWALSKFPWPATGFFSGNRLLCGRFPGRTSGQRERSLLTCTVAFENESNRISVSRPGGSTRRHGQDHRGAVSRGGPIVRAGE